MAWSPEGRTKSLPRGSSPVRYRSVRRYERPLRAKPPGGEGHRSRHLARSCQPPCVRIGSPDQASIEGRRASIVPVDPGRGLRAARHPRGRGGLEHQHARPRMGDGRCWRRCRWGSGRPVTGDPETGKSAADFRVHRGESVSDGRHQAQTERTDTTVPWVRELSLTMHGHDQPAPKPRTRAAFR